MFAQQRIHTLACAAFDYCMMLLEMEDRQKKWLVSQKVHSWLIGWMTSQMVSYVDDEMKQKMTNIARISSKSSS